MIIRDLIRNISINSIYNCRFTEMERTSHNDSREEDKRGKEAKSRYNDRIKDARSESRIEKFMPTKLKDPREKLQEIPHNQAKDRRQKIFEENRSKKKAPREDIKKEREDLNLKELAKMVKELSTALREYERITNQEIDNIKKIIEKRSKTASIEYEKYHKTNIEIDTRIQNVIEKCKEISQSNLSLKNLVEEIVNKENKTPKQSSYSKFKNQDITQAINLKTRNHNITKAILYDRYRTNKAKMVTKGTKIIVYPIKIQWNYNRYYFYILYRQKWQLLRNVATALRKEGLIFGARNIIAALKEKYKNIAKKQQILKTQGDSQKEN